MGFDCDRFENPSQVDGELICSICSGVFDNPVQLPECEHVFCAVCIERWLLESSKCPLDRKSIQPPSAVGDPRSRPGARPAPRIFRTLLGRMRIRCLYHTHGCTQLLALEHLEQHELTCPHNPEGLVTCDKGCGTDYKKSATWEHNCVAVLKDKLEEAMALVQLMSGEMGELKRRVKELEGAGPRSTPGPGRRSVSALWPAETVMAWARHLPLAQVTYWGGLISTPDTFLQNQVREALENNCLAANGPLELIEALMHNSHERAWPPGLRTLERRLFNRTIYEAYACRRVPGNQAVIVLSEDNRHMSDDMILHPGLVVIFAHGVEDCDLPGGHGSNC